MDSHEVDNRVTLTFDLLILGSMHAKRLSRTVCLRGLVLIAQAFFILKRGHTDIQIHTLQITLYPRSQLGYRWRG